MATLLVTGLVKYRSKYPKRTPLPLDLTNTPLPDLALLLSDCYYDLVEAEKNTERIKQQIRRRLLRPSRHPRLKRQISRAA